MKCQRCSLDFPKPGESAIGQLLCMCGAQIDTSGQFPVLREKQNNKRQWIYDAQKERAAIDSIVEILQPFPQGKRDKIVSFLQFEVIYEA